MKLKVVPAMRGWMWMRQGVRLSLKQPLGFMSLVGLIITGAMLLIAIPVAGAVVIVSAMPVVWMGFILSSHRVQMDARITPGVLIEPLKEREMRPQWLRLGGAYTVSTFAVMALAGWLGPSLEELSAAMDAVGSSDIALNNGVIQSAVLWRLGLTIPISLVFWHTPVLLHWGHVPASKALFFSAVASWRNLGAFIVYAASWLGLLLIVGLLMQLAGALVPVPMVGSFIAAMGGLWVASAFYASLYFSVMDCFEPTDQQLSAMAIPAGSRGTLKP